MGSLLLLGCGRGNSDTTAPTITSSNTASVDENDTLSHALTADESVTWSIIGGADQAEFEISGSTLRWASNGTQDFENPQDADTNNVYVVQVRATDGSANTSDQTISVTVNNAAESSAIQFMIPDGYIQNEPTRQWMASGVYINEA